jgi:SAM-dependent methyltransferase
MLRSLSSEYVAVDYSPEMVDVCRQAYPGLDVHECDARDLSMFDDETFSLVIFSLNVIDNLDHESRLAALAEMLRMLRRGDLFVCSTFNRNGPYCHPPLWAVPITRKGRLRRLLRPFLRPSSSMPHYRRKYQKWWHFRNCEDDHGSWALGLIFGHVGEFLAHWSLPSTERQVLGSLGSSVLEFHGPEGQLLTDDVMDSARFYVLARKGTTSVPGRAP